MVEEYNSCLIPALEADDLVAYYRDALKDENTETIICSPDKDVLHQLAGKHWDYRVKILDKDTPDEKVELGRWVETTQEMGDRFLALQLLMGDSGDNIPGIAERTQYMRERFGLDKRRGVGNATANRILNIIDEKYESNYVDEIFKCYLSKYSEEDSFRGVNDYQLNRKLLQLNTNIGTYNKILENYDISEHIKEVKVAEEINNEIEEF